MWRFAPATRRRDLDESSCLSSSRILTLLASRSSLCMQTQALTAFISALAFPPTQLGSAACSETANSRLNLFSSAGKTLSKSKGSDGLKGFHGRVFNLAHEPARHQQCGLKQAFNYMSRFSSPELVMKVILQKSVQKLGKIGDVVEAKPGFYRNYLQPRGMAVLATDGALKKREEELEALKAKAEKLHQEALALAERIGQVGSVKINQRAGDGGKLYGKVTHKDIAEAIAQAVQVEIDKKGIKTLEEITSLGTYKVYVKVATDVQAELNVVVYDETTGATGDSPKKAVAPATAAFGEEEAVATAE